MTDKNTQTQWDQLFVDDDAKEDVDSLFRLCKVACDVSQSGQPSLVGALRDWLTNVIQSSPAGIKRKVLLGYAPFCLLGKLEMCNVLAFAEGGPRLQRLARTSKRWQMLLVQPEVWRHQVISASLELIVGDLWAVVFGDGPDRTVVRGRDFNPRDRQEAVCQIVSLLSKPFMATRINLFYWNQKYVSSRLRILFRILEHSQRQLFGTQHNVSESWVQLSNLVRTSKQLSMPMSTLSWLSRLNESLAVTSVAVDIGFDVDLPHFTFPSQVFSHLEEISLCKNYVSLEKVLKFPSHVQDRLVDINIVCGDNNPLHSPAFKPCVEHGNW